MILPLGFIQNLGAAELIIIMMVALLLFGRKLPEVARNLGKGLTEFKRGVQGAGDEMREEFEAAADLTEAEKNEAAKLTTQSIETAKDELMVESAKDSEDRPKQD